MRTHEELTENIYSDLPCRICESWLHRFVEGEAHPVNARAVEAHLKRCAHCASLREKLEEERIGFLESAVVSPALSSRFAERVVNEIQRNQRAAKDHRLVSFARLGTGSVAAAGLVLLALLAWNHFGSPPPASHPDAREVVANALESDSQDCENTPANLTLAASSDPGLVPLLARYDVNDSIEFSASFFRLQEGRPCTGDVNHDGETDLSDAAHLFILAMVQPPSDLFGDDQGEIDLDCYSYSICRI